MPPNHLSGSAQALYRIFIAPSLSAFRPSASLTTYQLQSWATTIPSASLQARAFHPTIRSSAKPKLKPAAPQRIMNELIRSPRIRLVGEDRTFKGEVDTREVLASLNLDTHNLVQVAEADPGDLFGLPTCKIESKAEAWKRERQKKESQKAQKKSQKLREGKVLEINWGISDNDFNHYMKRARDFLEEGRRVEVVLMRKPKKTLPGKDVCAQLVERVREELVQPDVAQEWRNEEGVVGKMVTFSLEPPRK